MNINMVLKKIVVKYFIAFSISIFSLNVFAASFVTFESGQVRPIALSVDKTRLFAVNTPDNQLEIFDVKKDGLVHLFSIPVGLEPVAVAVKDSSELWVVNHLSDSVSIIDLNSQPPRVVRTLLVGDEPRDIIFAGPNKNKAFITTAHRGQNSPYSPTAMPFDPGEITQPGIGRADVWVFDSENLGTSLEGDYVTIITLFTDTPRALTVSADGSRVYAAGFHTGNKTASISEGAVCDGGASASSCNPAGGPLAVGGSPVPNESSVGVTAPEVGLIVKYNGTDWQDEIGRNWNNQILFNLPDKDVFEINANADIPVEIDAFSGVGTILYNMATNPVSGKIYISNTEAINHIRFEGQRNTTSHSSVIGHQHETRITVIDPTVVNPTINTRHLNKHIDYSNVEPQPTVNERSLAIPTGMTVSADGKKLFLAVFGSSKVSIFDTTNLEDNTFVPDSDNHVTLSGGGPSGLVLNDAEDKLFVFTRFNNSISIVDISSKLELSSIALHNPEPLHVVQGRPFLYDARFSSNNGEASCGSCHVFGDLDSLAWDLGDPEGSVLSNPNLAGPLNGTSPYHPMKGPMTTQSLRGLLNQGPLHWRGDRTAGRDGGDPMDTAGAFKEFNVAFVDLLGRENKIPVEAMDSFTEFVMDITYPPNPNRPLDNSLTLSQESGSDFFFNDLSTVGFLTCNACHVIDRSNGFFGSNGLMSFDGETQDLKIAHLRNMYQKVGMFGMPMNNSIIPGDSLHMGNQIRGFGFIHDGSVDSLFRFHSTGLFGFPGGDAQRREVEQFMHAMDTNLMPIVGQQITLNSKMSASVLPRFNLLINQAGVNNADLIIKGNVLGEPRGWVRLANGNYQSDKSAESTYTSIQLEGIANVAGQDLTIMSVPFGSGVRIGIDRDEDTVLNADDNCPAVMNLNQSDVDGDGVGDLCDSCISIANTDQRDSNGDGFGNRCDADLNNDGIVNAIDLGLMRQTFFSTDEDSDLNGDGLVNAIDLGLFKQLFLSTPGPSAFQ